jgi:hypothetical protein
MLTQFRKDDAGIIVLFAHGTTARQSFLSFTITKTSEAVCVQDV